jgi:transposase
MVAFGDHHQYYLYTKQIDMRKGIDSLCGIVIDEMQSVPTNGHVYVFFNKPLDKIKILVWDIDGYVLYMKRLEKGRFENIGKGKEEKKYSIKYTQLVMLMSGISLVGMKQKSRYKLPEAG